MKHTIENIARYSYPREDRPDLNTFHFDHSGHVVTTNSHVLFASSEPFDIKKGGRTFDGPALVKGESIEVEKPSYDWKTIIPNDNAKKVTIEIPEWFKLFEKEEKVGMILDHSNLQRPFFYTGELQNDHSFAFNAKYLSAYAGETLSFYVVGPLHPILVLPGDTKVDPLGGHLRQEALKEDWLYILMPIKLDGADANEVYL